MASGNPTPAPDDDRGDPDGATPRTALESLGILAIQEHAITDDLDHVEIYTLHGLLTLLWHGRGRSDRLAVLMGGAMGGLLGPASGLYADLGHELLADDIATVRLSYRQPNDLDRCVHDAVAVTELAVRGGAERCVLGGHSFGGAVAVRAGIALDDYAAGVVTFATQSAGCEVADQLPPTPLRLYHGDRDELLPIESSEVVAALGQGELVRLEGTGHLLAEAGERLRAEVGPWISELLLRAR
jgi:hypothetical protein